MMFIVILTGLKWEKDKEKISSKFKKDLIVFKIFSKNMKKYLYRLLFTICNF